jgi:hypothetical protein
MAPGTVWVCLPATSGNSVRRFALVLLFFNFGLEIRQGNRKAGQNHADSLLIAAIDLLNP